MANLSLAD